MEVFDPSSVMEQQQTNDSEPSDYNDVISEYKNDAADESDQESSTYEPSDDDNISDEDFAEQIEKELASAAAKKPAATQDKDNEDRDDTKSKSGEKSEEEKPLNSKERREQERFNKLTSILKEKDESLAKMQANEERTKTFVKHLTDLYKEERQLRKAGKPVDPNEEQIRKLKLELALGKNVPNVNSILTKIRADSEAKIQQAEYTAKIDAMVEVYKKDFQEALTSYPMVDKELLAMRLQKSNDDRSAKTIAKEIYEEVLSTFEPHVLKKHRALVTAPRTISPRGSLPMAKKNKTMEDVEAEIYSSLGLEA